MTKTEDFECDYCDGCGWYEGGKTLKTTCPKCNGTGIIQKEVIKTAKPKPEYTYTASEVRTILDEVLKECEAREDFNKDKLYDKGSDGRYYPEKALLLGEIVSIISSKKEQVSK